VLAQTVAIDARSMAFAGGASFEVPAFLITTAPVTNREFRRFLASREFALYREECGRDRIGWIDTDPDDAPVRCDLDVAMAYARWVGGRLPTNEELHAANDKGWIDRRKNHREWVGNVNWPGGAWHGLIYDPDASATDRDVSSIGLNPDRHELPKKDGEVPWFRIAFSSQRPPATPESALAPSEGRGLMER